MAAQMAFEEKTQALEAMKVARTAAEEMAKQQAMEMAKSLVPQFTPSIDKSQDNISLSSINPTVTPDWKPHELNVTANFVNRKWISTN